MNTAISIDSIVLRVTQEVIRELARQGLAVTGGSGSADSTGAKELRPNTERIDMRGYRTPLVSERAIRMLHELTGTIVIPSGAIVTPMAKEAIRQKNLQVIYE
jgi:hypothetical protein